MLWLCLSIAGCKKVEKNCDGKMCTMELRTVSVKLTYADGSPVALDDFKVVKMPSGEEVTRTYNAQQRSLFRQYGSYPIASDADDRRFSKDSNTSLMFYGYIDSHEVVKSAYVIAFDCCHIQLVSGETQLMID